MKNIFVLIMILFLGSSCEKDPIPSTPVSVENIEATSIGYTSTIIKFSISGNANKAGVRYGADKELSSANIQYSDKASGSISISLEDLNQGVEYFYSVFAEDKRGNKISSETKNFITKSSSITTGDAMDVTTESAKLTMSFKGADINEAGIVYTTDALCKENLVTVSKADPTDSHLEFTINELDWGTTYYYKAFIKYNKGTIQYGEIKSFQTIDQFLKVSATAIEAAAEGGTYQFEIETKDVAWEISCDQEWCIIEPRSGNGNRKIEVSVKENDLNAGRTANIKVLYLGKEKSITLKQLASLNPVGLFTLSTLAACADPEGGQSCYFVISSKSSWSATSDQDWCRLQTHEGKGDEIIYYSVEPNNSSECRIARITVKDDFGQKQHLVVQDMKNNPIKDFCGVSISTSVSSMSFRITTPSFWRIIIYNGEWCSFDKNFGDPGDKWFLNMDYNYTSKDKTAIVKIESEQFFSYKIIVQYKEKKSSLSKIPEIPMVKVEGGSFLFNNEKLVTLDSYYIGQYEITQKQWFDVMGYNKFEFQGENLPVEMIDWNDIQDFIKKLNELTGKKYRLPTEAEWEYAARGGNKSKGYTTWSGSNDFYEVGWIPPSPLATTVFVGHKKSNELGIYDMSGNVGEFCSDWYSYPVQISDTHNPQGPSTGTEKVIKGWGYDFITNRRAMPLTGCSSQVGFRLVLDN